MAEEEHYEGDQMAHDEGQYEEGADYQEEGGELGMDADVDAGAGGDGEMEDLKRKLKMLEEETAILRESQGPGKTPRAAADADGAAELSAKEEADARSIYVGNVDYGATPEELQLHFQSCGTVNRVTILTDRAGNPKGYAYIEFLETDAVENACLLDNSELRGRNIKVTRKRTNVPGLKRGRGRGRGRGGFRGRGYHGGYGGGGYYGGYGYGYAPRGRGRGRGYSPY